MMKEQLAELEEQQTELNIVDALLEAGAWRKDNIQREFVIPRNGHTSFTFKCIPISEDIFRKCRRRATIDRGKPTEELDDARFTSNILFEATIEEDKKRIWKNKAVWAKINAVTGSDVVLYTLKPAERQRIAETILKFSGYDNNDDSLEDLIKNE